MRRDKKDIEEVSRQRIAIIRQDILRELIVWTLREAHRIVLFRTWWALFHWLVYKREQKYQEGMKLCKRCEKLDRECWHPFEDFYKNVKDKHGLSDYCSKCCNELCAATREKNPEAARERKREWYKMHPEKMLEYRRRAYAKNPKRYNRATRKWQRENAERWNAYNRAYRARKKAEREEA